ncbi:Fic family protein [Acetivibrio ethanolgignens]|uniref:Cell filamentation protein Fic n=1 Tax=Acetivibrio ethanolgignens TaxID=290052 RepID=A0A0V8QCR0_9FIRM|nr:Fic family protein [Acetivibrio ethanolgignens]KSV58357.1 cell filamentation protein Fic [Acetivibrio ethanolgignens]
MGANYSEIQELLQQRADIQARINLIPYDGNPEIKEVSGAKYLYIRKRVAGKLTSTYVDTYSDELYQLLLRNAKERKDLNKSIRKINKELATLGYEDKELSTRVLQNLDFARANMKANIYDQAVLEGVATSFPQTEDIIENGQVNGVSATDVQKILNLKHAWEFILDRDVIQSESNYYMLCHIAKLVNEGFFYDGGRIRGIPVQIGGTSYVPPLPIESVVIERIDEIRTQDKEPIDIAIELCMYCMKTQVFKDGNKRASVIFANHYLIAQGMGFLVIPEMDVSEFKTLLVEYYEGAPLEIIGQFLREKCWKNF